MLTVSSFCFFPLVSACPLFRPCVSAWTDNAAAAGVTHVMRMSCGCHAGVMHVMYTRNSEYGIWNENGFEWNGTGCEVIYIPVFAKKTVLRDVGCALVGSPLATPQFNVAGKRGQNRLQKTLFFSQAQTSLGHAPTLN